jgi:CRP-like cAMP-binding protein
MMGTGMPEPAAPLNTLVHKLALLADLDEEDRLALRRLPCSVASVRTGHHLVREGAAPTDCCLLVDGYACRYKVTAGGGRQIVSFHMRGDILDLQHLLLSQADHHVQAFTAATVAWIPNAALHAVARGRPRIGDALWKDTLIDASIFREWVLNVGRRDAKARIAHMLCEFLVRCEAAGLGSAERIDLPMTQEHIADATGLTSVHVNRMLRALEEDGVIHRRGREMRVRDWELMKRVADFDPVYLHSAAA